MISSSAILLIDKIATILCIRVLSVEVNLGTLLFTDFRKIKFHVLGYTLSRNLVIMALYSMYGHDDDYLGYL